MSYSLSISGHSNEDSADQIKDAARSAFSSMSDVGAYGGSLSGSDASGQSFSLSFPEAQAQGENEAASEQEGASGSNEPETPATEGSGESGT